MCHLKMVLNSSDQNSHLEYHVYKVAEQLTWHVIWNKQRFNIIQLSKYEPHTVKYLTFSDMINLQWM